MANEGYEKGKPFPPTSDKLLSNSLSQTIGIRTYGIYQKLEILKEELDVKE
jgi:hypothetical protein